MISRFHPKDQSCATTRVQIPFSLTPMSARPFAVGGRLAVPSAYIAAEPGRVGQALPLLGDRVAQGGKLQAQGLHFERRLGSDSSKVATVNSPWELTGVRHRRKAHGHESTTVATRCTARRARKRVAQGSLSSPSADGRLFDRNEVWAARPMTIRITLLATRGKSPRRWKSRPPLRLAGRTAGPALPLRRPGFVGRNHLAVGWFQISSRVTPP